MKKRLIAYRNGGRVSAEGSLHAIPYIDLFDYLVSMAVAFEQYELSHWILLLVPLSSAHRVVLLGNWIGSLHRAGDSLRGAERWLEASDGEVANLDVVREALYRCTFALCSIKTTCSQTRPSRSSRAT